MRTARHLLLLAAAVALVLGGCSSGGDKKAASPAKAAAARATTTTKPANLVVQITPGPALPAALSREVALADGDHVLLLGGLGSAGTSTAGVFRVDPATGSATKVGTLAQATHDAAGAVVNGGFVVFGGGEAHTIDAVQSFVPGQATRVIGHLPQPRSDLVTAVVDGKVYVLGGFDGTHATGDVLETSDGVHFAVVAKLPTAVRYAAVAVTGHRIWLFGGESGSTDIDQVQVVDVDTRTAQVAGHLPVRLAHASALVVGGRVFIAGGRLNGQPTSRTWQFDPDHVTAVDGPALPRTLLDAAALTVGDTGYLFGGESPKPIATTLVVRLVAG